MSSNYSVTQLQVITSALRKLGVLELGSTPGSADQANATIALNLIIKQMAAEGLKMWKNSELKIPITSGKTQYILGGGSSDTFYDVSITASPVLITDKPLKAVQGFYRNNQLTPAIDTPVLMLSKQEYLVLGSKYTTGVTNSFFYDPKATYGILNLYLTPDLYSQTNLEFHMVAQMPLNDNINTTDVPDFPNEWFNCIVWNLADQLALEYLVPHGTRQEIALRAKTYREEMTNFDVEASSSYFQPDYRNIMPSSYAR
jgi:hypothetical protein